MSSPSADAAKQQPCPQSAPRCTHPATAHRPWPSLQVGSIFEYANQRPVFDVIQPDSPLYTPILGFFAITGLPTAGYLFYKAVQSANKAAERMDKLDGY